MSLMTMPILIINLGGEMLYVLEQRLRIQNEPEKKIKKVMTDIVSVMFSKEFMGQLMQPQEIYSPQSLRAMLTHLTHIPIMKLNSSMRDRLYELMTMAFKYQVAQCPRPRDLLLITFNHMDGVRCLVKDNPSLVHKINEVQRLITEMYAPLSNGDFQVLRQTLLTFFQDVKIPVLVFLKEDIQNPDGSLMMPTSGPVPHGSEVPGMIRYFNSQGKEVKRQEFVSGGNYTSAMRDASFGLSGDRVISLGTNMYSDSPAEEPGASGSAKPPGSDPNPLAKVELDLLAKLMGQVEVGEDVCAVGGMRLSVFPEEKEEAKEGTSSAPGEGSSVVNIQAASGNTELRRIAAEFTEKEEETGGTSDKGEDLLSMMDKL
ncbi:protein OSCP1a [Neoarius graeffei]|uniref:protein OSCP1a n=1 Tax=Neoarius graeffei TaxID=443677 RepID=UPI00298CBD5B|nr:protein OSCP1a [Neoarius graeffei]